MASSESSGSRTLVAAFGKHPGWDDHIPLDQLGCDQPGVAELRKLLYIQGIGGNIDAGSWDALLEQERIDRFAHIFLWRRKGELWAGRLWHSTDGRGRQAYPMVVVARCTGLAMSWVVGELFPMLEALHAEIDLASSPAGVDAALQSARQRIAQSADAASAHADSWSSTAAVELEGEAALGPERQGLHRVLYQFRREFAPHLGAAGQTRSGEERAGALRAPRAAPGPAVALVRWLRFANEMVHPGAPILVLAPLQHEWVDVLIGDPGPDQLFGLKASKAKVLLASDVPYNLSPEAIAELDAIIDRPLDRARAEIVQQRSGGLRDAVQGKVGEGVKTIGTAIDTGKVRSIAANPLLWVAVAAGAILVLGLLLLVSGGGGGAAGNDAAGAAPSADRPPQRSEAPRPQRSARAPEPGEPQQDVQPTRELTSIELAAWQTWCDAYGQWLDPLLAELDPQTVARDEHLSALLPDVRRLRVELDPRGLATGRARLATIRDEPPAGVRTDDGAARVLEAARRVEAIRAGVTTNWPALQRVRDAAAKLERHGWASASAAFTDAADAVSFEQGASPAAGIEGVVELAPLARSIATLVDEAEPIAATLASIDDPVLSRAAEAMQPAGQADTPASAQETLAAAVDALRNVERTARERWDRIDRDFFLESAQVHASPPARVDAVTLGRWRAEVSQDRFDQLAAEDDPRRQPDWVTAEMLASLRGEIGELAARVADGDAAAVGELAERLESLSGRVAELRRLVWNIENRVAIEGGVDDTRAALASLRSDLKNEQLALSMDFDGYVEELRRPSALASAALSSAWEQWRERLIERHAAGQALRELREDIERAQQTIDGIEQRVRSVALVPAGDLAGLDRAIVLAAATVRAESARAALASAAGPSGQGLDEAWQQEQAALERWRAEVAALVREAEALATRIDRGERVPESGGLREEFGSLRGGTDQSLARALGPIQQRIDRIDEIRRLGLAEQVAIAQNATTAREALAAWRALGSRSDWPRDAAAMASEARSARYIVEVLLGGGGGEFVAEVAEGTERRWSLAMQRAATPDELRTIAAIGRERGNGFDALDERVLANLAVAELTQSLVDALSRDASDPELRSLLAERVAAAEARGLVSDFTRPWWESVRELAESDPSETVMDFSSVGPGRLGWAAEDDGREVVYRSPDGRHSIAFFAVETEDTEGGVEFVSRTEVSVGLLSALSLDAGRWEALGASRTWRQLASAMEAGGLDSWRGARSWQWDPRRGAIVPGRSWLENDADGQRYPEPNEFFAPVTPPGADSPLQQVSASAADQIAAAFGCRLPSLSAWLRAVEVEGADESRANLRDRAFAIYQQHQARIGTQPGVVSVFADSGIFVPQGFESPVGRDARSLDVRDQALWFEPVDVNKPRGDKWLHLLGNVAEFVRGPNEAYLVVGGSALSDPAIPLDQPQPVLDRLRSTGFSDVGFRLAFDFAGLEANLPVARRAQRLVNRAPFDGP